MKRKPRPIVDTVPCAWCTNPFERTSEQRRTRVRHCSRRCAAFGRAVTIPDAHWRLMNARALQSRLEGREERLAGIVAPLSKADAYRQGYKAGYSAGKARRRALLKDVA